MKKIRHTHTTYHYLWAGERNLKQWIIVFMSNVRLVLWERFVPHICPHSHRPCLPPKKKKKIQSNSWESLNQGYRGDLPECHTAPWIPSGPTSSVFWCRRDSGEPVTALRVRASVQITISVCAGWPKQRKRSGERLLVLRNWTKLVGPNTQLRSAVGN